MPVFFAHPRFLLEQRASGIFRKCFVSSMSLSDSFLQLIDDLLLVRYSGCDLRRLIAQRFGIHLAG